MWYTDIGNVKFVAYKRNPPLRRETPAHRARRYDFPARWDRKRQEERLGSQKRNGKRPAPLAVKSAPLAGACRNRQIAAARKGTERNVMKHERSNPYR